MSGGKGRVIRRINWRADDRLGFMEVEAEIVPINGFTREFFLHWYDDPADSDLSGWRVSDAETGGNCASGSHSTKEAAIAMARKNLAKVGPDGFDAMVRESGVKVAHARRNYGFIPAPRDGDGGR